MRRINSLSGLAKAYAAEHNGYLPDACCWEKQLQKYARRSKQDIWHLIVRPLPANNKRRFLLNRDVAGLRIRSGHEIDDHSYGRLVLFIEGDTKSSTASLDSMLSVKGTFYVGLLGDIPATFHDGHDLCCGTNINDFVKERRQIQKYVKTLQKE